MALTLTATGAQLLKETRRAASTGVEKLMSSLPEDHLRKVAEAMVLLATTFREVTDCENNQPGG